MSPKKKKDKSKAVAPGTPNELPDTRPIAQEKILYNTDFEVVINDKSEQLEKVCNASGSKKSYKYNVNLYRMDMNIQDMRRFRLSTKMVVQIRAASSLNDDSAFVEVWPNFKLPSGQVILSQDITSNLLERSHKDPTPAAVEVAEETPLTIKFCAITPIQHEAQKVVLSISSDIGPDFAINSRHLPCDQCVKDIMRRMAHTWKNASVMLTDTSSDKQYRISVDEIQPILSNMSLQSIEMGLQPFEMSDGVELTVAHKNDQPKRVYKCDRTNSLVGGYQQDMDELRHILEMSLNVTPDHSTKNSTTLYIPSGVLLHGPSGTGKSHMGKSLGSEFDIPIIEISCSNIFEEESGQSEAKLETLLRKALDTSPCILFFDEIDALCPQRSRYSTDVEKHILSILIKWLEARNQINGIAKPFCIAATNQLASVEPSLRRIGRFDKEIEINIPTQQDRRDIIGMLIRNMPNSLSTTYLDAWASKSHGFVGSDLEAVTREAGILAVRRKIETKDKLVLTEQDVSSALEKIKPSAMREVVLEVPKVHWEDIGGQAELKRTLKEIIEWPLKNPEAFRRMGINPPKGVLFYGPPGCSKTLMAKAIASEADVNFLAVKGPELFSKYVGDSEKALRSIFKRARAASPSIIFFDEIDSMGASRGSSNDGTSVADRVLSQLLTEMDGIEPLVNVTIIGATNRPDRLDKALLRPGRFDRIIYIPPPDYETRREILHITIKDVPLMDDVKLDFLASKSAGFSGAETASLCQSAAFKAMERDRHVQQVSMEDFETSIAEITPNITEELLLFYKQFENSFRNK